MQNGGDVVRAGAHAGVTWKQAALQEQRMSTGSFSPSHSFEGAACCLPVLLHCSSLYIRGDKSFRQRSRSLISWGLLPDFSFASLSYLSSAQRLFFYVQLKDSSVSFSYEDYQSFHIYIFLAAFERGTSTGEPPSLDIGSAPPTLSNTD